MTMEYCKTWPCLGVPALRGYCRTHYDKERRQGFPDEDKCQAPGCESMTKYPLDFCVQHWKTYGKCSECESQLYAGSLCRAHYERLYRKRQWIQKIEDMKKEGM